MLVISLSTIPSRFAQLGETLDCLLAQTAQVDAINLYIPAHYNRFPDWDGQVPDVPDGITIRRTDQDFGPATKVLAAAREFAGQNCEILFCDDDRAYPPDWAAGFLAARSAHQDCAIAALGFHANEGARNLQPRALRRWRITDLEFQARFFMRKITSRLTGRAVTEPGRRVWKRSGYVDIFEGCGGVLVRPEFFDDTAFDIPDLARSVDDVWLSGMLAAHGVPIWLDGNRYEPENTAAECFDPLVTSVIDGADRADSNRAAIQYLQKTYGIWPDSR